MFKGQKVLVIVPARGGSKGIKLKNLIDVAGKPLIAYTLEFIKSLEWVDDFCVSSDNEEILKISQTFGALPVIRPETISGDLIGDLPVIKHAMKYLLEKFNFEYDIVVLLQPTSPIRLKKDIEAAVTKLLQNDCSAIWSISEVELKYHPDKQLQIDSEGKLSFYTQSGKEIIARQQLSTSYIRNGVFYIFKNKFLKEADHLLDENTLGYLINSDLINIDNPEDVLKAANLILNKK